MAAGPVIALLLAAAQILQGAGVFAITLRPDHSTTIRIEPGSLDTRHCALCEMGKSCVNNLQIKPMQQIQFTFGCPTPEMHWILVIERKIDCLTGKCPFGDIPLQPLGLPHLNRTFVWVVKTNKASGLELKFSTWLRQITPGHTCSNQVIYDISTDHDRSIVPIGRFCTNGSISRVKVQGGVIVNLQLPWNSKLNTSGLKIENRSAIKRLCIIESIFQSESSVVLMSPNYPLGFPDDQLMTWQFVIPSNLRAHVVFLNTTRANCDWQEQKVEYHWQDSNPVVYDLGGVQPVNIPGSFNLTLQNCHQDPHNPGALNLMFKVVFQYPQNEKNVTYTIDLTKEKKMNVTIYSKTPHTGYHLMNEPFCLICTDVRNCRSNLTLSSGEKHLIMLLCKNVENIRINGTKSIECYNSRACTGSTFSLIVPPSLTQLPIRVENFTWKLTAPRDIAIEIKSPTLKLKQSIRSDGWQGCNGLYSYVIDGITPGKELSLGWFCPGQAIEKIQITNNVTVSLVTFREKLSNDSWEQDLKMSFIPTFKENCAFTVTPSPNSTVLLQTPNLLEGLPPHMSVSWNISVPPKQVAQLAFVKDQLDVACDSGRVSIYIKEQRPNAMSALHRDDEFFPKIRDMHHSFWINISNCKPIPKRGLFVQFKVTLFQKKSGLAVIIGAVIGGIAVVAAIVLVVCCVKKKSKKKGNEAVMVGVYNANVNTQIPGQQSMFKKGRKNNESHVYAVIDDSMVYGHLLDGSSRLETAEVGVYQPFSGPMITVPPSPPPFRKTSKVPDTEESSFIPVNDNETYTFAHRTPEELRSNGDMNVNGNGSVGNSLLENSSQEHSAE